MEIDVYETNYFTLVLDGLKSCDYLVKNYSMCAVVKSNLLRLSCKELFDVSRDEIKLISDCCD